MINSTKGKWRVDEFKDRLEVVSPSEEVVICRLSVYNVSDKANAKLIASAPELYVALKDVGREMRINDSTWGHGIFIHLADWKEHYEPILSKIEGK